MNWIDIRLRLRAILFPARVEDDLDEELRLHLAMQIRRNLESGMSQAEARRHAAVQFGGLHSSRTMPGQAGHRLHRHLVAGCPLRAPRFSAHTRICAHRCSDHRARPRP